MLNRARPIDVAEYILSRLGPMSAMKLQKLVYYCQAWSLAWTDEELFREEIEAWSNGPVIPSLYRKHKGVFKVSEDFFGGDPSRLSPDQKQNIRKVLDF